MVFVLLDLELIGDFPFLFPFCHSGATGYELYLHGLVCELEFHDFIVVEVVFFFFFPEKDIFFIQVTANRKPDGGAPGWDK